jgi:hypothetical protein
LLIATLSVPFSEYVTKSYKKAVRKPINVTLASAVYDFVATLCAVFTALLPWPIIVLTHLTTIVISIDSHMT